MKSLSATKAILALIAVCTVPCLFIPACSGDSLVIDADKQLAFADQLFEDGQFLRAAEEYQRFIFFFADRPDLRTVIHKAGMAFFNAGDFKSALQQFERLAAGNHLDTDAVKAHFMIAETYLRSGSPTRAIVGLHNLISLSDDTAVKDRAYFRLAWLHIDQGNWREARKTLGHVSDTTKYPTEKLNAALDRTDAIPQKSPALAGTLSIVPGAGQLYCGRYQDALIAFLLNTGLIWAAVDAYNQDQYALGGLLTFVGAGFYAGNIYGAVSDAHKYNRDQKNRFKENLRWQLRLSVESSGWDRESVARRHRPPNALVARISFCF